MPDSDDEPRMKSDTLLTTEGRDSSRHRGMVNTPVYRGSTILADSLEEFESRTRRRYDKGELIYGLLGTPTTFALEDTIAAMEGGERAIALPSGLAAVTLSFLANTSSGGHVLVTDNAYLPSRRFCETVLSAQGVEVEFYDPLVGAGIADLIRDNTQLIFTESPGSSTFEVQDIPAISEAAHSRGVPVALDNTWATPLFFRALDHGADIAIHAVTKYFCGHADVVMGAVVANGEMARRLMKVSALLGFHAAPDDCYQSLRGIRSLSARMERHARNGMAVANWLRQRPEVERLLHPAFADCPGHDIWKRDFSGAGSLFSIVLDKPYSKAALGAMLDNMRFFGIGASWGAFESLMIPANPAEIRTATRWDDERTVLRLFIGLEDPDDLTADLEAGFARLHREEP